MDIRANDAKLNIVVYQIGGREINEFRNDFDYFLDSKGLHWDSDGELEKFEKIIRSPIYYSPEENAFYIYFRGLKNGERLNQIEREIKEFAGENLGKIFIKLRWFNSPHNLYDIKSR